MTRHTPLKKKKKHSGVKGQGKVLVSQPQLLSREENAGHTLLARLKVNVTPSITLVPAIFPLSPPKKVRDCKGKGLEQSETQMDQEGKGFKETSG